MTLQHGNRVRKNDQKHVVRELQAAAARGQSGSSEPTAGEIERRAYGIYLARNGAPGNAELDWLQAEMQLRACKAAAAQPDRAVEHE